jgi:hypothetical protein
MGSPFADIPVPLPIYDSRKMAFAALDYIHAWDIVQQIRRERGPSAGATMELYRRTGEVH